MDGMNKFIRGETVSTDVNTKYLVTLFHLCPNMKLTCKKMKTFIAEYFPPTFAEDFFECIFIKRTLGHCIQTAYAPSAF